MQNNADASIYKLSETLAWNSKWLRTSATIWRNWAHYQGIGHILSGREIDDKNWGWNFNASRLVDPIHEIKRYNPNGYEIYNVTNRMNNRIVMLGCRWSL